MNQPYEPTPPTIATKALEVLKSLPSVEDTQTQVEAAVTQIRTAASHLIPAITWETPHDGSGDTCQRPYEETDGRGYALPDEVAVRAPVSEQQWAQILQLTKDVAAKLDATEVQVFQDEPGDHDVRFYGPARLSIGIGYRGNLVISGYTGCRLPRNKK